MDARRWVSVERVSSFVTISCCLDIGATGIITLFNFVKVNLVIAAPSTYPRKIFFPNLLLA
jgi:hypothetical protein